MVPNMNTQVWKLGKKFYLYRLKGRVWKTAHWQRKDALEPQMHQGGSSKVQDTTCEEAAMC